jgi:hypothetical protein
MRTEVCRRAGSQYTVLEVVPTKSARSHVENTRAVSRLRAVYGELRLDDSMWHIHCNL